MPSESLLDSNVFLSYLKDDELANEAQLIIDAILDGRLHASVSSSIYDDVITAMRSKEYPLSEVKAAILGMAAIPHVPIPVTPEIALTALALYEKHGGSRKLHYFDSFHVATALHQRLPLITSDKYIVTNDSRFGITAISLRNVKD